MSRLERLEAGMSRRRTVASAIMVVAFLAFLGAVVWVWLNRPDEHESLLPVLAMSLVVAGLIGTILVQGPDSTPSWEALADELGFDYHPLGAPGVRNIVDALAVTRRGALEVEVRDTLTGTVDALEIFLTLLTWPTDNKSRSALVLLFRKPDWHVPVMVASPEGLGNRLVSMVGGQDIDVAEDPDFSRAFQVTGSQEEEIRALLDEETRTRMRRLAPLTVETYGSVVAFYGTGLAFSEIRDRLPHFVGLVRAMVERSAPGG